MKKTYYVHGIQGYYACLYERLGPYRWEWLATYRAYSFVAKYPCGCALVNQSPEKPPIIK